MVVATLFALSALLTIILTRRRKLLEARGTKNTLPYYLIDNALLVFFQPLAIVLAFYYLLLLATIIGGDYITTGTLIKLERQFLAIKTGLGWFKDPLNVLRALEILFFIGIFGVPLLQTKRVYEYASKYRRRIKFAYSIAVLLCSFTLLGSELGEPARTLSVHITKNRTGYGALKQEVSQATTQSTAHDLYQKAPSALPTSYNDATKNLAKLPPANRQLTAEYQEARQRVRINRIPEAERIAGRQTAKSDTGTTTALLQDPYETAATNPTLAAEEAPRDLTGAQLQSAREALAKRTPPTILLLQEEGGKAVIIQAPKVITDRLKTALTEHLVHEHPILGALFSIISSTIDNTVEARIKARIENITRDITQQPDPTHADRIITENAKQIADTTAIRVPPAAKAQADQAARTIQRELNQVQNTRQKVAAEVQLQISKLIDQLQSPKESVRERAVEQLGSLGDKVNEKQVRRLETMLRDRTMRWSKPTDREGHCTWYEKTSVSYYAGKSLGQLRSPHVNDRLAGAARDAIANGTTRERVTDPGWI